MRSLFVLLAVLIVLVALFVFSGIYNVAAVQQDSSVTSWLLATVRDQSVANHSQGIHPPLLCLFVSFCPTLVASLEENAKVLKTILSGTVMNTWQGSGN